MARYEYTRDRKKIHKFILSRGFKSDSDFAKAVGIARQNLCGFMSGIFNPDIHSIIKMATAARCDLETITELFYQDEIENYRKQLSKTD